PAGIINFLVIIEPFVESHFSSHNHDFAVAGLLQPANIVRNVLSKHRRKTFEVLTISSSGNFQIPIPETRVRVDDHTPGANRVGEPTVNRGFPSNRLKAYDVP